jgi:C-terminal processing protease CtpA/Prc
MVLDPSTRARVVESAATKLAAEYVDPSVGERMAQALRASLRGGEYDRVTSSTVFADLLTEQLRAICHDKHLHVDFDVEPLPPEGSEREDLTFARIVNYGFETAERLEGNIGYLEIRGFLPPKMAALTAHAALAFIADTRALIIDLRRNGGGRPEMVGLVASYLFDHERIHLNDIRYRRSNRVDASWTLPLAGERVYGRARPIYVLTSERTFSGGEELAYDLQVLHRAIIVGETTGGGANPNELYNLTEHFGIAIPVGRGINPVTHTSWERVGVRPDVAVPASQALLTAQLLALKSAEANPQDRDEERYLRRTIDEVQADLDRRKASH